jgi:3-dehydroquinate dehydratase/shikimate dehydrogenase
MPGPVLLDRAPARLPEAGVASVVATLTRPPADGEVRELAGLADGLEVRAELAGDLDPDRLRSEFPGTLTYSLRRGDTTTVEQRHRRLLAAARHYDTVELEHEHDLVPALLERIPPAQRRVAWYGPPTDGATLAARFERMAAVPAGLYLLAVEAATVADGLAPLALLKSLARDDVTAFATGRAGGWTRLLAPRLGAPVAYAAALADDLPGSPTLRQLRADYGFPAILPLREIFGIVGGSERHSLAPRILNTGFRAVGMEALYLPFFPADFGVFWRELASTGLPELGLPLRGLTVVRPHKEAALAVAATTGGRARDTGAANCLTPDASGWHAANTTGLLDLLAGAGVDPRGLSAAVIGCGGAGRSVAAELTAHGGGGPRGQPRRAAGPLRQRSARPAVDLAGRLQRPRARPGGQRNPARHGCALRCRGPSTGVGGRRSRLSRRRRDGAGRRRSPPRSGRDRRAPGARGRDRFPVPDDDRTAAAARRG